MLMGVKIMKYTRAITIGAIIRPSISPNLIQDLFKGVNSFELITPSTKKGIEIIR